MKQPLRHIIGRVFTSLQTLFLTKKTIDETVSDYEWWDKFRHSLVSGYEVAGAISNNINKVMASWVLGRGVDIELTDIEDQRMQAKVKYTNDVINRLMTVIQSLLQDWYDDYMGLGDLFIYVNPDATFVNIPPNTVRLITDPLAPKTVVGIEVITITTDATIVETFTKESRTRQIAKYEPGQTPNRLDSIINSANSFGLVNVPNMQLKFTTVESFPNPIGRIPIVHFAQGRESNELRGHPFVRDIRSIMSEYNDLAMKSMQGAKVSGNPLPVFEGLENPEETIELNTTISNEDYIDKDDNSDVRRTIRWDELPALFLGKGGKFNMAAPPVGFSTDTIGMLKFFRNIIRESVSMPNSVFGGDDTIDPNMKERNASWVKIVEGMRDKFAGQAFDDKLNIEAYGGLYELIQVWLLTKKLVDPRIIVAPVTIHWTELTEEDKATKFEEIKWAHSRGGLRTAEAVRLLGLVENPETEYELAQAELKTNTAMQTPQTDFGGVGNTTKNPLPPNADGKPDLRAGNGADVPRMPPFAGGGRTQP